MNAERKNKLSVIVITKNEESRMRDFLDSLQWADEIVVVDDESADRTREICEEYGAKVIVNQSSGNFDKQRNIGIDNANSDWIIQMDADEVIPEDVVRNIKSVISNPEGYVGFKIRRRNFIMGYPLRYAGSYNYMDKIFKKDKVRYIGSSVHEVSRVDGDLGIVSGEVLHYPLEEISAIIEKWNLYSKVGALEYLDKVNKVNFGDIRYELTWKSLKLFWKLYIRKKGYKDGMYGLIWCVLNVIGPQIKWVRIWEYALKQDKLEK